MSIAIGKAAAEQITHVAVGGESPWHGRIHPDGTIDKCRQTHTSRSAPCAYEIEPNSRS